MAGQHPAQDPDPAVNAYDYPKVVLNPDGTFPRLLDDPKTPAVPDPDQPFAVRTKDVPLDPTHDTWARIYLPRPPSPLDQKLPIIVYYHGGAYDSSAVEALCGSGRPEEVAVPSTSTSVMLREY
ncbi:hypothetical protein NL676_004108 [Syzygium grande]|nr:hypothetical protein NL676_004108 [Syzygium grande]